MTGILRRTQQATSFRCCCAAYPEKCDQHYFLFPIAFFDHNFYYNVLVKPRLRHFRTPAKFVLIGGESESNSLLLFWTSDGWWCEKPQKCFGRKCFLALLHIISIISRAGYSNVKIVKNLDLWSWNLLLLLYWVERQWVHFWGQGQLFQISSSNNHTPPPQQPLKKLKSWAYSK